MDPDTPIRVHLPADRKRWADEQARVGGFAGISDYVCDLLRRGRVSEQAQRERRRMDATLVEAVESGATQVMDDADWASIRRDARAAACAACPD